MKVEKVERVETVTLTMTHDQLYLLQRIAHSIDADDVGIMTLEMSKLRNDLVLANQKADEEFGAL